MKKILKNIRKDLTTHVDIPYKKGAIRFFTEPIKIYGVRTPLVRKIAQKYWLKIKDTDKKTIFALCEELLKSNYNEEATIAFSFAKKLEKGYTPADFQVFEKWVRKYLTNWAMVDDFTTHALGALIYKYPILLPKVFLWTKSNNMWVRRASAVTLIHFAKKKQWQKEYFLTADALLSDKEDLVQKGYGWMLKEVGNHFEDKVFEYILKNKNKMTRTALRYAIEKMPKDKKTQAMN
ncbi:MAG: DNA alkylation repair protein [Candidatus Magasanikbacteria bacterium]